MNPLSSLFTRVIDYVGPRLLSTETGMMDGLGRQLAIPQISQTRWHLSELEGSIITADAGNLRQAGRLCEALRRDGVIHGALSTRFDGLVQLPLRFRGDRELVSALEEDFREVFPSPELALLAGDGRLAGVAVGEFVQIEGAKLALRRLDPQWLWYRWYEDRWYYQSKDGFLPINPGDGRWVLHLPGGNVKPWSQGLWMALGRAYIAKEHAYFLRENYSQKLANAARVAVSPAGASEGIKQAWFAKVAAWGSNTIFGVPPGYDVRLLESNGRGYEVFSETIESCDKEFIIALAGQLPTTTGGQGFANAAVHAAIRSDLIQSDADSLAATLNLQAIPVWANETFGAGARGRVSVAWDITPPKDLNSQASAMTAAAAAVKTMNEVLAAHGLEVDVHEIARRFGVPTRELAEKAGLRVLPGGGGETSSNDIREAA